MPSSCIEAYRKTTLSPSTLWRGGRVWSFRCSWVDMHLQHCMDVADCALQTGVGVPLSIKWLLEVYFKFRDTILSFLGKCRLLERRVHL